MRVPSWCFREASEPSIELFEALTLIQTGKVRDFPVVLADRAYWQGLIDWTRERLLAEAKIAPEDLDMIGLSDDPKEIVKLVLDGARKQGIITGTTASAPG